VLHHSFKNVIRFAIKFGAGLTQFIYRWEGLELEADHLPLYNTWSTKGKETNLHSPTSFHDTMFNNGKGQLYFISLALELMWDYGLLDCIM